MIELSFLLQQTVAAELKEKTYAAVEGFHHHKTTDKVSCCIVWLILMLSDTKHAA